MMHEEVAEFPAIQGFLHTRQFGLELSKIASPRPIPSQPVTNPPFLKNNRGPVTRLKPLANTWRIMAQTLQRPGRQAIIIANDLIHKWFGEQAQLLGDLLSIAAIRLGHRAGNPFNQRGIGCAISDKRSSLTAPPRLSPNAIPRQCRIA